MPPSSLLGCSSKSLLRALQPRLGKHLGPFQKQEKHFFCCFFLTVFACNFSSGIWVEWFHRGFGWKWFVRGFGRKIWILYGAFGGRPPLALWAGQWVEPSHRGCARWFRTFSKMKICTENWRLVPAMAGIYFIPVLVQVRTVKEYLKACMPLTRYTYIHFQNGRVGVRLLLI